MSRSYDDIIRRLEDLERRVYDTRSTTPSSMMEYTQSVMGNSRCIAINRESGRMYVIHNDGRLEYPCGTDEIALVGSLLYIGHDIVIDTTYPFHIEGDEIFLYDDSRITITSKTQMNAIRRMFNM